jgi:hypothetical protein
MEWLELEKSIEGQVKSIEGQVKSIEGRVVCKSDDKFAIAL